MHVWAMSTGPRFQLYRTAHTNTWGMKMERKTRDKTTGPTSRWKPCSQCSTAQHQVSKTQVDLHKYPHLAQKSKCAECIVHGVSCFLCPVTTAVSTVAHSTAFSVHSHRALMVTHMLETADNLVDMYLIANILIMSITLN